MNVKKLINDSVEYLNSCYTIIEIDKNKEYFEHINKYIQNCYECLKEIASKEKLTSWTHFISNMILINHHMFDECYYDYTSMKLDITADEILENSWIYILYQIKK